MKITSRTYSFSRHPVSYSPRHNPKSEVPFGDASQRRPKVADGLFDTFFSESSGGKRKHLHLLLPWVSKRDATLRELGIIKPDRIQSPEFDTIANILGQLIFISQMETIDGFSAIYSNPSQPDEPTLLMTYVQSTPTSDIEPNPQQDYPNIFMILRPLSHPITLAKSFSVVYANNAGEIVQKAIKSIDSGQFSPEQVEIETQKTIDIINNWIKSS